MRRLSALICLAIGLMASGFASAQVVANTPLDVSASVVAAGSCTVTTSGVSFGSIDGTTPVEVAASVSLTCASGASYLVAFDAGLHYDDTFGNRQMQNPNGDLIAYELTDVSGGVSLGDNCSAGTFPSGLCMFSPGTDMLEVLDFLATTTDSTLGSNTFSPGSTYTDTVNVTVEL